MKEQVLNHLMATIIGSRCMFCFSSYRNYDGYNDAMGKRWSTVSELSIVQPAAVFNFRWS